MRVTDLALDRIAFVDVGRICSVDLAVHSSAERLRFDAGPGTCTFDWAGAVGGIHYPLLELLLADPYFAQKPPKTTQADQFDTTWLQEKLRVFPSLPEPDLRATLIELTARCVRSAIALYTPEASEVRVRGEAAGNAHLLRRLTVLLPTATMNVTMSAT